MDKPGDKRIDVYYRLVYTIFSTSGSIVYNWSTRPINRRLYSGIFKDPIDIKYKTFKIRLINKFYVLEMVKLNYF